MAKSFVGWNMALARFYEISRLCVIEAQLLIIKLIDILVSPTLSSRKRCPVLHVIWYFRSFSLPIHSHRLKLFSAFSHRLPIPFLHFFLCLCLEEGKRSACIVYITSRKTKDNDTY